MRICLLMVLIGCCRFTNNAYSQDSNASSHPQIEILSLKLQLAEEQLEQLQTECKALRQENATLKKEVNLDKPATDDPFAAGVVWAGEIKRNMPAISFDMDRTSESTPLSIPANPF